MTEVKAFLMNRKKGYKINEANLSSRNRELCHILVIEMDKIHLQILGLAKAARVTQS